MAVLPTATLAPVIVTAVFASALPTRLAFAPVKVMAEPRGCSGNAVSVPIVAAVPSCQNTFCCCPPLIMATEAEPVVMAVPTWMTQTALASPPASRSKCRGQVGGRAGETINPRRERLAGECLPGKVVGGIARHRGERIVRYGEVGESRCGGASEAEPFHKGTQAGAGVGSQ